MAKSRQALDPARPASGASRLTGSEDLWPGLLALNRLPALLLLTGALLKETPEFWLNRGGYPVELRMVVQSGFYPLLILDVLFVFVATVRLIQRRRESQRSAGACLVSAGIQWGLLGLVGLIVISNNLENLRGGLPLHWHGP